MEKNSRKICKLLTLKQTPYREVWQLQQELAAARRRGSGGDTFIVVEHPPVYTMGRAGSKDNIKAPAEVLEAKNLEVVEVDRGGDVTYHGPGQVVGYPILDLKNYGQDLHHYSRMLEEVLIRTLAEYGIEGFREQGLTGVWTKAGKIAAIGIGVRSWVTMHGFSLNVNPDMEYFSLINPCGITHRPVISMHDLGVDTCFDDVCSKLVRQFAAVFDVMAVPVQQDDSVDTAQGLVR